MHLFKRLLILYLKSSIGNIKYDIILNSLMSASKIISYLRHLQVTGYGSVFLKRVLGIVTYI